MTTNPNTSSTGASNRKDPLVERPHPNVAENKDNAKSSTVSTSNCKPSQTKAPAASNHQPRRHNRAQQTSRRQDKSKQNQQEERTIIQAKNNNNKSPKQEDRSRKTKDPRQKDRLTKAAQQRGKGRNTESFDPTSTLVRPAMRIRTGSPTDQTIGSAFRHDDVMIVPNLLGATDDYTLYHTLCQEMTQLQESKKGAEWIAWHEGAHLICKQPAGSPTFQSIVHRLCEYFQIDPQSAGTRLNWYKDSRDWKPFHHDSAAFNPQRAQKQNITVGVSFGATRELAFLWAKEGEHQKEEDIRLYFPQPNNGVFSFGRDVNIRWKHGINALPLPPDDDGTVSPDDNHLQDTIQCTATKNPPEGRISIILWGLAANCVEEEGSPAMLGADGQGPHAAARQNRQHKKKQHHRKQQQHGSNNNHKPPKEGEQPDKD